VSNCVNEALKSLKNLTKEDLEDYLQKVAYVKSTQGVSNTMAAEIVEKQALSDFRNSVYRNDYAAQQARKILPSLKNNNLRVGDYLSKNSRNKGGENVEINIQAKKSEFFNHVFNKLSERAQNLLVEAKNDFTLAKLYDKKVVLDHLPKEDQSAYVEINQALHDWIEKKSRYELIKSTAYGITDLNLNRILKTTYNPFKIKNIDQEIYAKRSAARANLDVMFPGVPAEGREAAGEAFFRKQYLKVLSNENTQIPEVKDIPELNRRSRMFVVWKDMQNYLAHEQECGFNDTLMSSLMEDINDTARQAGISTVLGPDPAWMMSKMIKANPKYIDGVNPMHIYQDLRGALGPYSQTGAAIGSAIREYTGAVTLGLIMPLITRTDYALGVNLLKPIIQESEGAAILNRVGMSLKALVDEKGVINDPVNKKILQTFSDGLHAHIGGNLRSWSDNGINSLSSKVSEGLYKYSGQAKLDIGTRLSSVLMVSKYLAMMKDTPFKSLPDGVLSRLRSFNINEPEWDAMRGHFTDVATVDTLDNITEEQLAAYAKKVNISPAMAKSTLFTKLYAYHQASADENILYPGAQERAFFHRGTQSGTVIGELARTVAQYKGFLAAYTNRLVLPGLRGNDKFNFIRSQLMYVSSLAVLSNGLSNVISGKPFNANPVNWDAADWINNLLPAYFTFSSMLDKSDPSGDFGKMMNALFGTPTTRLAVHAASLGINTAMLPFHYLGEEDEDKQMGVLKDELKRTSSVAGDVIPLYNPIVNNAKRIEDQDA